MTFPYPYVGPIAPGNNYPINANYYEPKFFFISDIYLGQVTTVTTTEDHDYVIGQGCRLIVPPINGCRQLNESQGMVIEIPSANQLVLNIDSSRNVDLFQSSSANTQPQILAVSNFNGGSTNSQGRVNQSTFIPGSFINISPE